MVNQVRDSVPLDSYVKEKRVHEAVSDVVTALLAAKPANPRKWLLAKLEAEMTDESEDLNEVDLHRLFAVSRKITSEIMPQETINLVISETIDLLGCDRVSLFVLDKKSGMLRLYASNLETPISVSPGQGIAGSVLQSRETVNIADCYKDRRFDKSFDRKTGYVTKSLIAVPIQDFDGSAVGVIQAINKLPRDESGVVQRPDEESEELAGHKAIPFARDDEKILWHLTQHVGIALRNADVYREAISTSERATGLLNTIQSLSQDLGTQSLLLTITMHANKIVSAQRSTVFLLDEPAKQLWSVSTDTGQEIRIPMHVGIAGQCCREGVVINIPDAYQDERFNQEIDKKTGFKTQTILAVPMFRQNAGGGMQENAFGSPKVVGIIQMINKVSYDGQLEQFDDRDVEVMELFAKFVGQKLAADNSMVSGRTAKSSATSEAEMAFKGDALPAASKRASTGTGQSGVMEMGLLEEGDEEEEG